jgi:hypothetical protein
MDLDIQTLEVRKYRHALLLQEAIEKQNNMAIRANAYSIQKINHQILKLERPKTKQP